jgi:DNA-binding GntR family transcriptional regulator
MQNHKAFELISIDRREKRPYDLQIKDRIKALILDQTFYYQDILPDPLELANVLNIDEEFTVQAYKQLNKESFIKKTEQGYEIAYLELTNYFFDRNVAIYDAIIALGLTPSIECVSKKVVTLSDEEAKGYGFDQARTFLYINRIYKGNQRPLIILENYLPISIFPDIDQALTGDEPLNAFIFEHYGLYAKDSHRITKAVNLPERIAKYLNEPAGSPSISSTNHVYDQYKRLIDYGQSHSTSSYYFQSIIHWNTTT